MSKIREVVSHTGPTYFPIALIARLPYAMMVVGVLTLVVAGRGSMQLGGFNSAAVGLGAALFGPLVGAAADRYGQRITLIVTSVIHSITLLAFVWVVYSTLPNWVMLAGSFIIGASAPQTSPMSRSRLVAIVKTKLDPRNRDRMLGGAMAYESTADELVFVFGPFIVGALAVALGAGAPVIGAAILTLIFVGAFALHKTAQPAQTAEERNATLSPVSELFRPSLLIVVAGILGVGMFFGSMLTSLTAHMQLSGEAERAGLLYGIMGIGSAIFALSVAFLPPRFTKRARWLAFALIMVAGSVYLQIAETEAMLMLALLLIGCGIGPVLVTQYSFGADRSPQGRGATVMTMLGSGIIVGQSLASAITGWLSEAYPGVQVFILPLIAAVIVLVTGLINWRLTPPGVALSAHTGQIPVSPSA